jgi:hypothetical protein
MFLCVMFICGMLLCVMFVCAMFLCVMFASNCNSKYKNKVTEIIWNSSS